MNRSDRVIGEELCSFREGRGFIDKIFAVRQICEFFSIIFEYERL